MNSTTFLRLQEEDDHALRELLRTGDGPERVWAAWTLGLRLGHDSHLALAPSDQPDPGVRAQLIVVLAGFGERQALQTLAVEDPDPFVRSTALNYIMRTAASSERQAIVRLLEMQALTDPSPVPILAVLHGIPEDWPSFGREVMDGLLAHRSPEVRRGAVDYLKRTVRSDNLPHDLIKKRLSREEDAALLRQLARLLGPPGVTEEILTASVRVPDAAVSLVAMLVESGQKLQWSKLADVAQQSDPRVRLHCVTLLSEWLEPTALSWLVALATSEVYESPQNAFASSQVEQERSQADSEARMLAREKIIELISQPDFAQHRVVAPALIELLNEVEARLAWMRETESEDWTDEGVDLAAELAALEQRRDLIARALLA